VKVYALDGWMGDLQGFCKFAVTEHELISEGPEPKVYAVVDFAVIVLLAFAGGWVWRGTYDVWTRSRAKVYGTTNMVWGTTSTTTGAGVKVTKDGDIVPKPFVDFATLGPAERAEMARLLETPLRRRLRAVE
jgi:hypothetical protein